MVEHPQPNSLHVVVVGAGIGGLSCAIACRQAKPPIEVTVVERAPELLGIGAGIHIPPNACRIVTHLGLNEKLRHANAYEVEDFTLRRYENGDVLAKKPLNKGSDGGRCRQTFGSEWL
jgi:salicylate hydroxylase